MMFYSCPLCSAERCKHHVIPDGQRVELLPCPFCGGPPVPFDTSQQVGFKGFGEDGQSVEAYVFCHSSGAQGPILDELVYDAWELKDLLERAVLLWQVKHA